MQSADSSFLEFRDVSIRYGKKPVVFNVSMSVSKGSTFGLMGLNGAGKTTLIKALLGLREMESGEILLDGKDSSIAATRQDLAYLPERFDPPWFLKCDEFIRFSMNLYGQTFNREAMENMAVRLKLDPKVLGNRMSTYSKGMRQKAGLMATVLTGCNLLVLDEPMSGLDPSARAAVKDVLIDMKAQGRTIFFSSHILGDMDEICDSVSIINQGKKIFDGTPAGVKAQGGSDNLERAFLALIETDRPLYDAA